MKSHFACSCCCITCSCVGIPCRTRGEHKMDMLPQSTHLLRHVPQMFRAEAREIYLSLGKPHRRLSFLCGLPGLFSVRSQASLPFNIHFLTVLEWGESLSTSKETTCRSSLSGTKWKRLLSLAGRKKRAELRHSLGASGSQLGAPLLGCV